MVDVIINTVVAVAFFLMILIAHIADHYSDQ